MIGRPPGPQDVGGRAAGVADAERLPDGRVRDVDVDRVDVVREVDRLAPVVVERDVEVLGVHQARDGRVDLAVERLEVLGRAGRLGDPVEGRLDPFRSRVLRLAPLELVDPRAERVQPSDPGLFLDRPVSLGNDRRSDVWRRHPAALVEGEHSVRLG